MASCGYCCTSIKCFLWARSDELIVLIGGGKYSLGCMSMNGCGMTLGSIALQFDFISCVDWFEVIKGNLADYPSNIGLEQNALFQYC